MSRIAIAAQRLGKQYAVGGAEQTYGSFREMLTGVFGAPFRRFRALGGRVEADRYFWALRDVDFEIQKGEIVGVIGRNGAGKSTLLKVLSRITSPSSGRVLITGRVASLLEVGTGFHPELTGRENIVLNGSILGMTRKEINRKFDDIISFAEIDRFVDTPVKRYSSGMYVRLAFAVAAFLESDVLMVDEVLAVGDHLFQRRCLGKMSDVAADGRTIIFVSHNMGSIQNLCTRLMVLESGRITLDTDNVSDGVQRYLGENVYPRTQLDPGMFKGPLRDSLEFASITLFQDGEPTATVHPEKDMRFEVEGTVARDFSDLDIVVSVFRNGTRLFTCHDSGVPDQIKRGAFKSVIELPRHLLRPGRYSIAAGASRASGGEWIWGTDIAAFEVMEKWSESCRERDEGAISITYKGARVQ